MIHFFYFKEIISPIPHCYNLSFKNSCGITVKRDTIFKFYYDRLIIFSIFPSPHPNPPKFQAFVVIDDRSQLFEEMVTL